MTTSEKSDPTFDNYLRLFVIYSSMISGSGRTLSTDDQIELFVWGMPFAETSDRGWQV